MHSLKYGDNGKIVRIYTDSDGLLSFLVQGFSSKNSFKKIHFQALNILQFTFYHKQKNHLHRIKEVKLENIDTQQQDIKKLSIRMFISELLHNSIKEEEQNPELYAFIRNWLTEFNDTFELNINTHLLFTLDLTKHLGFYPHNENEKGKYFHLREGTFGEAVTNSEMLSEEKSKLLHDLLKGRNSFSNNERRQLIGVLMEYYKQHLSDFKDLKSKSVLEVVLS